MKPAVILLGSLQDRFKILPAPVVTTTARDRDRHFIVAAPIALRTVIGSRCRC